MKVRVINDETGWTKVIDVPSDRTSIRMPFIDEVHGGFGMAVYQFAGEQDAHGLPIFRRRTREP
jgi:hypothetical protein